MKYPAFFWKKESGAKKTSTSGPAGRWTGHDLDYALPCRALRARQGASFLWQLSFLKESCKIYLFFY